MKYFEVKFANNHDEEWYLVGQTNTRIPTLQECKDWLGNGGNDEYGGTVIQVCHADYAFLAKYRDLSDIKVFVEEGAMAA